MRTGYFYPQVFALPTSTSFTANAAPAGKPELTKAPVVMKASANAQSGTVDLDKADAPTLQRDLPGVWGDQGSVDCYVSRE
jgi:competence protein ComEA